jgi:hypothetical protein
VRKRVKRKFSGHLKSFEQKSKLITERDWYKANFMSVSQQYSACRYELNESTNKICRDQFMIDELRNQTTKIKIMQSSNLEDARQIMERAGYKVALK